MVNVVAALAVFVALFHGLCCVADPVASPEVSVTALAADNPWSDLPDPQYPGHSAHCSHCLCHAGYQSPADMASLLLSFDAPIYVLPQDRVTRSLAGLPPFKPPRA